MGSELLAHSSAMDAEVEAASGEQPTDGCAVCLTRVGRVHIDQNTESSTLLFDVLTRERVNFGAGDWGLVEDAEEGPVQLPVATEYGQLKVIDFDGDGQALLMSPVFVYTENRDMFIMDARAGIISMRSLSAKRATYVRAKCTMRTQIAATFEVSVYVFLTPRAPTHHMFWQLADFYELFELKSCKGQAAASIGRCVDRWARYFSEFWLDAQIIFSSDCSDRSVKRVKFAWVDRGLPHTSIATTVFPEMYLC